MDAFIQTSNRDDIVWKRYIKIPVKIMVDTETAREIDSLRCDVSVQGTLLNYANKVVETEKKKVAVVAHDSKIVLNSLLEDIQEVRVVVGFSWGGVVSWLVGWHSSTMTGLVSFLLCDDCCSMS